MPQRSEREWKECRRDPEEGKRERGEKVALWLGNVGEGPTRGWLTGAGDRRRLGVTPYRAPVHLFEDALAVAIGERHSISAQ